MADAGHAINVANLNLCIGFANDWGAKYQPSNPLISIANMTASAAAGEAALDDVQVKTAPYRNATGTADDLFDPMSKRTTRVMRATKACGMPASAIEDANTYARKIKGQRATPKKKDDPNTAVDESKDSVSASQMSRTNRIENLDSIRTFLESQPLFVPNETDLTTGSLKTYSNQLKAAVDAITTTFVPFSNSLSGRDDALYINNDAVVAVGKLFKVYVEAAFGRNSAEWQQVKALQFKDRRRSN